MAFVAMLAGRSAVAQDSVLVVGTVVSSTTGLPVPYGTYSVSPNGVRRFTNADGGFSVKLKSHATSRLAIRQLGYAPLDTALPLNAPGGTVRVRLALSPIAYRLSAIRSLAQRTCVERTSPELSGILEELKKNADRELILRQSYPFQYRLERVNRYDGAFIRTDRDTSAVMSNALDLYVPGHVVRDRPSASGGVREMRIPQLTDLANDEFISHHCFFYGGSQRARGTTAYVIGFEPTRDVTTPDVMGSVMLDTATLQVVRATFVLTRYDEITPAVGRLEVTTTYHELFPGVTLFRDINSVETFPPIRPTDAEARHTEHQRLIGVKFISRSPQDADTAVLAAVATRPDSDVRHAASPNPLLTAADSARARASAMEADLHKVGFYERETRFPSAHFFGLAELDRRINGNPSNLFPEIPWVRIGRLRDGTAISSERCGLNVYVNGRSASIPSAESGGVRRARLTFGPELPVSDIGAVELYPATAGTPREYSRDYPTCGLILLWTRPGITTTTVPN